MTHHLAYIFYILMQWITYIRFHHKKDLAECRLAQRRFHIRDIRQLHRPDIFKALTPRYKLFQLREIYSTTRLSPYSSWPVGNPGSPFPAARFHRCGSPPIPGDLHRKRAHPIRLLSIYVYWEYWKASFPRMILFSLGRSTRRLRTSNRPFTQKDIW